MHTFRLHYLQITLFALVPASLRLAAVTLLCSVSRTACNLSISSLSVPVESRLRAVSCNRTSSIDILSARIGLVQSGAITVDTGLGDVRSALGDVRSAICNSAPSVSIAEATGTSVGFERIAMVPELFTCVSQHPSHMRLGFFEFAFKWVRNEQLLHTAAPQKRQF